MYLIWNGVTGLFPRPQEFLGVGHATRKRLDLDQALAAAVLHPCSVVMGVGGAIPDCDKGVVVLYCPFLSLLSYPYLTITVLQKLLTNGK